MLDHPTNRDMHGRCRLPPRQWKGSQTSAAPGQSLKYGPALYPCLVSVQLKVSAFFVDQLLMFASLYDLAIFNHKDLIRLPDSAQPVGNDKCSPAPH